MSLGLLVVQSQRTLATVIKVQNVFLNHRNKAETNRVHTHHTIENSK